MDSGAETMQRRRILVPQVPENARQYFQDDCCANCLDPLDRALPGLFCGSWCSETASTVRYARRVYRDARTDADPLILPTIRMRLAFLMAGGYGALGRNVPGDVRDEVVRRDGGRCVRCGEPANQVDHRDGNDNTTENLQLLCDDCHRQKTGESLVPASEEEAALQAALWVARIFPDDPILFCDDEMEWAEAERRMRKERSDRLADRLRALGHTVTKRMTHAARVALLSEAEVEAARLERSLERGGHEPGVTGSLWSLERGWHD